MNVDMYSTVDRINELLGVNEAYKASDELMRILYDKERRTKVFKEFLKEFNYDVSYDWFHLYFQDEHADRKNKKQDFTPNPVADLLSGLVGGDPYTYTCDIAAGTGGLTIRDWQNNRMKHSPFDYKPSMYLYHCEELSDRTLPFLLFNLMIRGMNATVLHGDTLSRSKVKGVFFVQNDNDDLLQFSSLNLMPYTENVRKEFGILSWADEKDRHKYIRDTKEFPEYLVKELRNTGEDETSKAILKALREADMYDVN